MEYLVKNLKSVRLKRERKLFEVKMGSFVRRSNGYNITTIQKV
jgi:hypothetical protein